MKQLVDFLPVFAFVGVYVFTDIFVATAALMATAVLQFVIFRIKGWPVSRQMSVVIWVALISGGLTLVLQDKTFIQWKPTIVYWIMGGAIIGSRYVGRGDYIQRAMGKMLVLPDPTWARLTFGWGAAMVIAGFANLAVAYGFSEQAWVLYKFVSAFGIPLVLTLGSVAYLAATEQLAGSIEEPSAPGARGGPSQRKEASPTAEVQGNDGRSPVAGSVLPSKPEGP